MQLSRELDLKIKCVHKGDLILWLRGIYATDFKNNIILIFIEYASVIINGKQLLSENQLVCHVEFYECHFEVEDKDSAYIHIEWSSFKVR